MNTNKKVLLALVLGASGLIASFAASGASVWNTTIHLQKANAQMANSVWYSFTAFYKSDTYDITSFTDIYAAYKAAGNARVQAWGAYLDAPAGSKMKSHSYQAWLRAKNAATNLNNIYRQVNIDANILNARNNIKQAQLYLGYALQAASLRQ